LKKKKKLEKLSSKKEEEKSKRTEERKKDSKLRKAQSCSQHETYSVSLVNKLATLSQAEIKADLSAIHNEIMQLNSKQMSETQDSVL